MFGVEPVSEPVGARTFSTAQQSSASLSPPRRSNSIAGYCIVLAALF